MAIQKPGLFTLLGKWRRDNNLTTPEWKMYVTARAKQEFLTIMIAVATGFVYGVIASR